MSQTDCMFKGDCDVAALTAVDIDLPLADAKIPECRDYHSAYARASKTAQDCNEHQRVAVYKFLEDICGFILHVDTPAQPFGPLMVFGTERSAIPEDLSPSDLEVVRELSQLTRNPALSARLLDVLWERTKDHKAGQAAIPEYVCAAKRLTQSKGSIRAIDYYHRALRLAAKFGRGKKAFSDVGMALTDSARSAANAPKTYVCNAMMRVMLEFGIGVPSEFASIASSVATQADASGDYVLAREYRLTEADWYKRDKDDKAERKARLAAADTYVLDARSRVKGKKGYMVAAHLLSQGIEALRRSGAPKSRVSALRTRLSEYQKKSMKELSAQSATIDVNKLAHMARKHVATKDFYRALMRLAFGRDLTDLDTLKKGVLEAANTFTLQYLVQRVEIDSLGRPKRVKGTPLNLQGEEVARALEQEMFEHARQYDWPIRVMGFIEPARIQVFNDWHPTFSDLMFIVRNNPFIPPGHESIFLRGIHAGFHEDFVLVSHLLVPQIENSLRYVLETNGIDVSNLLADGTQPVKILGGLFDKPEMIAIFGESLCFELRGCLIEKSGWDFRNRVAHGFVSERDCHTYAAVTIWWLILRICLYPTLQAMNSRTPRKEKRTSKRKRTAKHRKQSSG